MGSSTGCADGGAWWIDPALGSINTASSLYTPSQGHAMFYGKAVPPNFAVEGLGELWRVV